MYEARDVLYNIRIKVLVKFIRAHGKHYSENVVNKITSHILGIVYSSLKI